MVIKKSFAPAAPLASGVLTSCASKKAAPFLQADSQRFRKAFAKPSQMEEKDVLVGRMDENIERLIDQGVHCNAQKLSCRQLASMILPSFSTVRWPTGAKSYKSKIFYLNPR